MIKGRQPLEGRNRKKAGGAEGNLFNDCAQPLCPIEIHQPFYRVDE